MRIGENSLIADDKHRKVESLTRRETRGTVYNIEVGGKHVFYVGNDGVLVHDSCAHHMHHTIPRGTQRRRTLAGRHVAGGAADASIRGWIGLPNRILVSIGKHRKLHSGKEYSETAAIGGGHHNHLFHQKILQRGGYHFVTVQDILEIRDSLVERSTMNSIFMLAHCDDMFRTDFVLVGTNVSKDACPDCERGMDQRKSPFLYEWDNEFGTPDQSIEKHHDCRWGGCT